ncbi:MAG TPA: hypothetical protein DFH97_00365 [Clostridiales bacterium]|nr:hypothetical protein [Clostridiales bacterium]
MKRVLVAIVTIALLLTACGAEAPAEATPTETVPTETVPAETTPNYLGTWKLDYLLVGNSKIAQSELESAGNEIANMQFVLKDGGTAYMVIGSNAGFMEWSETPSGIQLSGNGSSFELAFEDGYLSLAIDNETALFQKVSDSQLIENADKSAADVPESSAAEEPETIPTTEEAPTETTALSESTIRPEFQAAMDAYEEFYDEYCDLMAQYTKNPTDFSLLAKYGNMLSKMTEIDEAFKKWDDADMSTAEAAYYLEVNGRVLQKLAKIMG